MDCNGHFVQESRSPLLPRPQTGQYSKEKITGDLGLHHADGDVRKSSFFFMDINLADSYQFELVRSDLVRSMKWFELANQEIGQIIQIVRRITFWKFIRRFSLERKRTWVKGAFVAGNDAGLVYNTYPDMCGKFFPSDYWHPYLDMKWRNFFENHANVQFNHRALAHLLILGTVAFPFLVRKAGINGVTRRAADLCAVLALSQGTLGVLTLLNHVPVSLGTLHQFGAGMCFQKVIAQGIFPLPNLCNLTNCFFLRLTKETRNLKVKHEKKFASWWAPYFSRTKCVAV